MSARLFRFSAGVQGQFQIHSVRAVCGETLLSAPRLDVTQGPAAAGVSCAWSLQGVVSNERYVQSHERALVSAPALGRPNALWGALIPIKKSAAWWALAQDERRAIFEERSRHLQLGAQALPHVARRLHHCRDLVSEGGEPAFDFLTWFDFAPEDAHYFDDLLGALRETEEWRYVEREVEVRVSRSA